MTPLSFQLDYDARGQLVLHGDDGETHAGVEPIRMFPISDPEHWIAICDTRGRELICIEEPANLPAIVRQVLDEELGRRQFFPVIERIVRIQDQANPIEWHVETDRGLTRFSLDSEDDVRPLGPHRALVIDASGVRYLIPDTRKLDSGSRRMLERYL